MLGAQCPTAGRVPHCQSRSTHGPKLASAAAWATLLVSSVGQIGLASPVQWIEAEHYESQHGSTASRFTMSTASGGACVDNGWGGQEDHFLRYKLNFAFDGSLRRCSRLSNRARPRPRVKRCVNITRRNGFNWLKGPGKRASGEVPW